MPDIIEKELSYLVNRCIFDVHNEVGPGLREECYQKAMEIRLGQAELPFISKPRTRRELVYLGKVADVFEPDFVISDRLILELKAQPEGLHPVFFRQTINYLKCWRYEIGLLVDFADASADIQRVVFHEQRVDPHEDFEAIRGFVSPEARGQLIVVRDVILAVHLEFGLGYSDTTYRSLLEVGFRDRGLRCQSRLTAEPTFRERSLPISPISPLLAGDSILVQVEAIHDGVTSRSIRTMQTHLQVMRASVGVVASFGQSVFELRGVRPKGRAN